MAIETDNNGEFAGNDPGLTFSDDGTPRSRRFGDIYYSLQDGLGESRAVFLGGCHLPDAWRDRDVFTVLELGFGTGLNIAALMQLWSEQGPAGGHLHIFTIEGFLMRAGAAHRALSAWPELAPFVAALIAQWPQSSGRSRTGFHYMDFPQWGISLTLALMDVGPALAAWAGDADAVFLDGFSPARNPGMWSQEVFDAVARRCAPEARLATFTVAGFVRRGLQAAGFSVEKCPGYGRKRERLEAAFTAPHALSRSPRPRRIAVIGAGIGGCALIHQARLMGIETDLFDAEGVGAGASGNAAALVTPRLDAGDNAISALFADSYAYAGALYRRLCPEAIAGEGLSQCASGPRDRSRFVRIVNQTAFVPGELALFHPGEDADVPGNDGIRINSALWVRPQQVLRALRDGQEPICATIRSYDGGILTTDTGETFGGYDAIIMACGAGIFDEDLAVMHDLRPVRGQVEWVAGRDIPAQALSWGGYCIPLDDGLLFGATHERGDRGCDVREADRTRNLDSLALVMPDRASVLATGPFHSRASVRVMTRDYLPAIGAVAPYLYVLTGLGARGFCLAPLLAKALLAELTGAPSPLPKIAKNLLNICRLETDQRMLTL